MLIVYLVCRRIVYYIIYYCNLPSVFRLPKFVVQYLVTYDVCMWYANLCIRSVALSISVTYP